MSTDSSSSGPGRQAVVAAVERSINQLVEDFKAHPFAHRVEHSLHVDLYHRLLNQPHFQEMVPIGTTPYRTRLVHKEWPSVEAVAIRGTARRRQNYDIAVLDPDSLAAASLEDFRAGRIPADVVIELGLDYDLKHLEGDIEKLTTNAVARGYLVHLSRKPSRSAQLVEDRIASLGGMRVAFVHLDARKGLYRCKGLDETVIHEESYRAT